MRRVLRIVALLVAAAVPCEARGAVPLGFNDNGVPQQVVSANEAARLQAGAGGTLHRFTFNWRFAERTRGDYEFSLYDSLYTAGLAQGIRPVVILMFAPEWTWERGVVCRPDALCPYPPAARKLAAFERLVRTLVRRYPKMAALEVWNEPNLDHFWAGGPDPEHYTRMVQAAARAVAKTRSRIPVLAGALSNAPEAAKIPGMPARTFLRRMYAAGLKGSSDGLSIHPYPLGLNTAPMFRTLIEVDMLRRRFHDREPVWVTELGATTTGQVTEAEQAELLVRLVDYLGARPGIAAVLLHTLVEPPFGASFETGFGIVRQGGSPKPAYCALAASRMRSPSNCALTLFGTTPDETQRLRWEAQVSVQSAVDAAARHAARHGGSLAGFDTGAAGVSVETSAGPGADPAQVGKFEFGRQERPGTLLCAASRADSSYCAVFAGGRWLYGHAVGTIGAAAGATLGGASRGW